MSSSNFIRNISTLMLALTLSVLNAFSQNGNNAKKVLVVFEGNNDLSSSACGEGRQLATLMGHFSLNTTIKGVNEYKVGEINQYDFIFYLGFHPSNKVPVHFAEDVLQTSKPVVWINTGFLEFSRNKKALEKYGFQVTSYVKKSGFTLVKAQGKTYTKGVEDINLISIKNPVKAKVLAIAASQKGKNQSPYFVNSGNLWYFSDSPFQTSTETDRYLYFCDWLHDLFHINHAENHRAIIRIEDVTPVDNPDKLRNIADILSERGIPFLVGVVPFYVNPSEDRRVSLSDKPEIVDALKYMVQNGGTLVMHGVTHQYRGISTDDFEFWDGTAKAPIEEENADEISKKIEMGIDEFMKNGLYPLLWETPHYTASLLTYKTVAKYFSASIEQKLSIEKFEFGQSFPYIIEKDLYGQKIYPENLGYVPLNSNIDTSRKSVQNLINNARYILNVRDGIACCFFHSFLNLQLLKQLADGISSLGYHWMDLSQEKLWVKTPDKVILTGNQSYSLKLDNSFLYEVYFDHNGDILKKSYSPNRIKGEVKRSVNLQPGQFYMAEPVDYHLKETTFLDKILQKFHTYAGEIVSQKREWNEAKVAVCWNQYARGAAYNDQSSFVSLFHSLNVYVDTIFIGDKLDLSNVNLLVVPYTFVDSLTHNEYARLVKYVGKGGNLVTDRKNRLIQKFGIKFLDTQLKVRQLRDLLFPQEHIVWKFGQLLNKFDYENNDEVYAEDAATGSALVLGKYYQKGKVLYFNTTFDPYSKFGYSHFPYAMEYVKDFFRIQPIVRRENLEFYFDPGLRQTTSVENLIKLWVKQGIRTIHVAGWHQYPKYNYDYKRLIKQAHANGILVYAWIEPPQVSQKFWQEHPQWREKNIKGVDVRPSWRYPVALTDPACLQAVLGEYTKFLKEYDWDGVNLAELYFESDNGFQDPDMFTPFNHSFIKAFDNKYHYDPRQIFNPLSSHYWKEYLISKEQLVNFRIEKITQLHDLFLKEISAIASQKPGFRLIVTAMDSHGSPELKENVGLDIDNIIKLRGKYKFLLQVEDPANKWSTDPDRYLQMGKLYASKLGGRENLLLDLNILSIRKPEQITPFPTLVQTGIESYQLIKFAATGAPRFTVYSEASVNQQDLNYLNYASAADVKYEPFENGYKVSSPYSFVLRLPFNYKIIDIDGEKVIGCRDNMFYIPAGNHIIKPHSDQIAGFSTVELQPQIISFTGNLLSVNYDMREINFTYESGERSLVSLTRQPTKVNIDGQIINIEVLKGNDCYTLSLPFGKHVVQIITGSKFNYGIGLTSLWSSNAIVIYGGIAVIMLVIMYLALKVIRKKYESTK
jgi:uncharacterized protein YdaL